MRPDITVTVTAGTLANMTRDQFAALRDNICVEGRWESSIGLRVSGRGDYIGVEPLSDDLQPMMFIGIERDGYTHS